MNNIYINSAEAITAVGHHIQCSISSLRAGLDCIKEIQFLGLNKKNLQVSPIQGYSEAIGDIYRYEALVLKALLPCLGEISALGQKRIIIYLGLPRPERQGVPDELSNTLAQRIVSHFDGINLSIQPVSFGRTSVFYSLKQAQDVLSQNKYDVVIVGGVDVLVNANSLKGLSEAGLLKEDWDGFIPGEAAAFLQVSLHPAEGGWGRPAVAITGIGTATETADGSADDPLVGKGVCAAFKGAMTASGRAESDVDLCINDVNGARAAFEDEAYGQIRFLRTPRESGPLEVWHPASYLGETGAAVGAIELIWASAALELGFAPGTGILASTSEANQRAAVYLRYDGSNNQDQSQYKVRIGKGSPILHLEQRSDTACNEDDPGLHIADIDNLHRKLAQENLDELSWLITMRNHHHLESGDPWADIEEFEERLVAHLDALVWAGDLGRELAIEYLSSVEMDEIAAAAMVLLSVPLDKTRWELLLSTAEKSDDHAIALISVLPHMPKETAEPVLLSLAYQGSEKTRSEAIRALMIAGWITEELIDRLLSEAAPELLLPVIEVVGSAGYSKYLNTLLPYIATQSQVLSDVPLYAAIAICQNNIKIPGVDYSQLPVTATIACALISLRDNVSYVGQLQGIPSVTPKVIEAIGWSGESGIGSYLVNIIEKGDDELKAAAANALYRIFGCELREEVEIDVSEPEDEEEEIQEIERLSQDPAVWKNALQKFGDQQQNNARLRFGNPWNKQSALQHLQRAEASYPERIVAAWEYSIVNNKPLPLHPLQFIEKQKQALSNLTGNDESR